MQQVDCDNAVLYLQMTRPNRSVVLEFLSAVTVWGSAFLLLAFDQPQMIRSESSATKRHLMHMHDAW